MLPNPLRRATTLLGAFTLLALAGPVASASAEVEASKITSPAGPTNLLFNATTESRESKILTIKGTTTGTGKVDVRCYYGPEEKAYILVAKEFEPVANEISLEVPAEDLLPAKGLLPSPPCVLRAVPSGDKGSHPPGGAADPFEGPEVAVSEFSLQRNAATKTPYAYDFALNSLTAYFEFASVGKCGLAFSNLVAPSTLAESEGLFDCNAALYSENHPSSGQPRSELQIDGANAYSPAAANQVAEELEKKTKTPMPGAPQTTVVQHFNSPSAGLVAIEETDPIVKCSPEASAPPTPSSCKEFIAAGVELKRTWQTSDSNRVAAMTDAWSSTDGAAHTLNALYDQETVNEGKTGGAYEFPETSAFVSTAKGESVTLPPGLGKIDYKSDSETPAEGDGMHPQGAIVYDTPPTGPLSVYRGTAAEGFNGFEMPYQATIPAGGSYTLRMAFVQAYKLSEVDALAAEVLAGYPPSSPPELNILSPANGTTVSTPSVAVSGTVADKRTITSLTVDGKALTPGPGGAWSTSVTLNKGANTIKAVASDQAGFSTERSVSVTYSPPPPPIAHASQVGNAKGNNGEVTFTVACRGEAGSGCEIEATLTTIEKIRHGRLVAVSARRHPHPKNHSERVVVGSSKVTIPAGQKVTISIPLNATGKSLLAQFGALPVHLSVVQVSAGHRSTVIAQNLTVVPHHRKRHHRHHHRHHHHH